MIFLWRERKPELHEFNVSFFVRYMGVVWRIATCLDAIPILLPFWPDDFDDTPGGEGMGPDFQAQLGREHGKKVEVVEGHRICRGNGLRWSFSKVMTQYLDKAEEFWCVDYWVNARGYGVTKRLWITMPMIGVRCH
jgi:hypothetical protein